MTYQYIMSTYVFVGESNCRTFSWPLLLLKHKSHTVCTHPSDCRGWSNSAGGDVRDFCRTASEWRIMILHLSLDSMSDVLPGDATTRAGSQSSPCTRCQEDGNINKPEHERHSPNLLSFYYFDSQRSPVLSVDMARFLTGGDYCRPFLA